MKGKFLALALGTCIFCFSGCRMVTVAEYQQLQDPESPFLKQATEIFDTKLIPQIKETALPLPELLSKLSAETDFSKACKTYGFRHAEEQQCNFPVKVEGTITAMKTNTRRGTITVTGADGQSVRVQIGPVIMGTALRDIQKGVKYADFNDQTVYGEYGERINARSVEISSQNKFAEGMQVEIYGAFSTWDFPSGTSSIQVAPVEYKLN